MRADKARVTFEKVQLRERVPGLAHSRGRDRNRFVSVARAVDEGRGLARFDLDLLIGSLTRATRRNRRRFQRVVCGEDDDGVR